MQELIKITEQNGKQAVNARDLHSFLGSKREFATWIKDRIKKYGLIENEDFIRFDKIVKTIGGRSIEYILNLDCAKELSMVENNEKGRQARKYFIEVEKQFKELSSPKDLIDFDSRLAALEKKQIDYPNDWTVDRYLRVNKLFDTLTRGDRQQLGKQCSKNHREQYGEEPKKVVHPSYINGQNVYPYELINDTYKLWSAFKEPVNGLGVPGFVVMGHGNNF